MLIVVASVGFVPGVLSEALTRSLTPKAWACVAGSGFCTALYLFHLARAYEAADFTAVYPVVRSLPVLMVAVGDVLQGKYLTPIGWLGMLLVACGCFLAPLHSPRDFSIHRYLNRTSLWMLLAALGTVGYTLLDKVASEVVPQGPATAARYGYIFFLIACGIYGAFLRTLKTEKEGSNSVGWRVPILGACLIFGAYWLVLWAYQMTRHASYIFAFRQFGIVIGVILAFIIYKERGVAIRLVGTFAITAGLVLIGLLGG